MIVGVAGLTGAVVGATLPEDLVHLAALPRLSKKITGLRRVEDKIVEALTGAPSTYGFEADLRESIKRVRDARWFVLSARRADNLLRERLFERAYALRVRARNYAGAELDMHFSLRRTCAHSLSFLRFSGTMVCLGSSRVSNGAHFSSGHAVFQCLSIPFQCIP